MSSSRSLVESSATSTRPAHLRETLTPGQSSSRQNPPLLVPPVVASFLGSSGAHLSNKIDNFPADEEGVEASPYPPFKC